MSKPPRRHPLEQGHARTIWNRFIGPLIRYKPMDQDLQQWLDAIFHTDTRTIRRYRVKKPFTMPGLYFVAPLTKVQGIGPRHVNRGDIIWARIDSTVPNEVQVEIERKTRGHVFSLDNSQFGWAELHLERLEPKRWSK